MAYRRSLTIRSDLLARRFNPSFSYVFHDDDRKHQSRSEDSSKGEINNFLQQRFFGSSVHTSSGVGAFLSERSCHPCSFPSRMGFDFRRHMSTSIGETSDKIGYISDVAGVISDTAMETVVSQAPVASEVAIAAAESWYPVAALQYLIDGVHCFTGLNWWASIALTTLLIRGATIPFLINQLKATTKLTIMRPKLDEIQQEMQSKGMMDPEAITEGRRKMNLLFKEYGVTPWTPIKGLFIQGPVFVSFFLGISNMAEKVPSFKHGGAFWFTDLTTPDTLYIFPVLTALTFLITVEFNMQEGLEGNPIAGTMKKFSRGLAVLTVPFTMNFPKAVFCYWVTSNLFSLMYGLVIKRPEVKKFLGIPKIPPPPPGTAPRPAFSLSAAYKQYKDAYEQRTSLPVEASADPPKLTDRKIPTSSVINQRIRSLEKQVKGRKKNKKRNYWKGRNYDPIDFQDFCDNENWILEDEPQPLTVDELESFRQELAACTIQDKQTDDEILNLDELDDADGDENNETGGWEEIIGSGSNGGVGNAIGDQSNRSGVEAPDFGTDWSAWG